MTCRRSNTNQQGIDKWQHVVGPRASSRAAAAAAAAVGVLQQRCGAPELLRDRFRNCAAWREGPEGRWQGKGERGSAGTVTLPARSADRSTTAEAQRRNWWALGQQAPPCGAPLALNFRWAEEEGPPVPAQHRRDRQRSIPTAPALTAAPDGSKALAPAARSPASLASRTCDQLTTLAAQHHSTSGPAAQRRPRQGGSSDGGRRCPGGGHRRTAAPPV